MQSCKKLSFNPGSDPHLVVQPYWRRVDGRAHELADRRSTVDDKISSVHTAQCPPMGVTADSDRTIVS